MPVLRKELETDGSSKLAGKTVQLNWQHPGSVGSFLKKKGEECLKNTPNIKLQCAHMHPNTNTQAFIHTYIHTQRERQRQGERFNTLQNQLRKCQHTFKKYFNDVNSKMPPNLSTAKQSIDTLECTCVTLRF